MFIHRIMMMAALSLLMVACSTVSETDGMQPRLSAAHVQPLALTVGTVEIKGPAATALPAGFTQNFPDLMHAYATRRFVGNPSAGQKLVVNLDQTDVTYARSESSNDVTRWMRLDGHDDYTLVARVRLTLQNAAGADQISHELALQNTLTLPDSLSLNEREARQVRFVEQFMADLDSRITRTLTSSFFVVTPGQ